MKIKCSHCNYEWVTASKREFVSCPNCLRKTKKVRSQEEPIPDPASYLPEPTILGVKD